MKQQYRLILGTFLLISSLAAQAKITVGIEAKNYSYKDSTGLSPVDINDTAYSAVYLIDRTISELYHTDQFRGETLNSEFSFIFKTYHERIKLNNDEAVERFNTMYIPVNHEKELLDLKARSINPDGTITDFNNDNIKFFENYEESGPMIVLALEGVQVGAEIEYIYTLQKYTEDYYGHLYLQSKYPKKEFSYDIIYPDYLEYQTKSYNGAPEMKLDSLNKDRVRLSIAPTEIKAKQEEESSADDANIQRIEYMLYANNDTKKSNIYSWKRASEVYTRNTCSISSDPKLAKKEKKGLKKIVKQLKLADNASQKDKIYAIESYLKDNIQIVDGGSFFVHEIFKKKTVSKYAATRVYVLLLNKLGVKHELVMTSNRFNKKFDGDFESYSFLSTFLIYFPSLDQFTVPANASYRLGMIPYKYSYQDGLFFKSKELGGVRAYFPEIKYIPGVNSTQSYDNMIAKIQFDEEFEKCKVFLQKELAGYSCSYLRPILKYLTPDQKEEILKGLLEVQEDAKVLDYEYSNSEMKASVLNYPFKVQGNVELDHLIEKAGNRYLFKIGLIIGPQMEMYQEKKRMYDVESTYNRSYKRTLEFTIPEGYSVSNLNDLTMNVSSSRDGKKTMEFVSNYSLNGNVLTVEVIESYDEIIVPIARYEEYRAVINAAADFNKITLVLVKN